MNTQTHTMETMENDRNKHNRRTTPKNACEAEIANKYPLQELNILEIFSICTINYLIDVCKP